jgi:hypothetical protein
MLPLPLPLPPTKKGEGRFEATRRPRRRQEQEQRLLRPRGGRRTRRSNNGRPPPARQEFFLAVVVLLCWTLVLWGSTSAAAAAAAAAAAPDKNEDREGHGGGGGRARHDTQSYYMLLGVSGTLQEGFPLRHRLDYNATGDDDDGDSEPSLVPAIFIGKALVRGFKAYLDVKDVGWREHVPMSEKGNDENNDNARPPSPPPQVPNAVVVATGCREHANLYHVYAVDVRQVSHILGDEPRFLGISSDAGLVDLAAAEDSVDGSLDGIRVPAATDASVRRLARQLSRKKEAHEEESSEFAAPAIVDLDVDAVAIPLVIGVHYHSPSYVESPVAYTLPDGTAVTSYAESLAKWAGVNPDDLVGRTKVADGDDARDGRACVDGDGSGSGQGGTCLDPMSRSAEAWDRLHEKTRSVEQQQRRRRMTADAAASTDASSAADHPHPATLPCRERARLGVGPTSHVRLNFPLHIDDLRDFL